MKVFYHLIIKKGSGSEKGNIWNNLHSDYEVTSKDNIRK
jgi:hypothetical protein